MGRIADKIAKAAESKIGVRESGGANKGPGLREFFDADDYEPNKADDGYAWCASFVCWCVLQAVLGESITFRRPQTPGAWAFEEWARKQPSAVSLKKPHGNDIRRGDIVVFVASHIGIAMGPPDARGYVPTVEGNTNTNGSREGDGVYRKSRHVSGIRSRIRITG